MYLVDSSSPFEPGARPSNSSEAKVLMWASNASGVMTSSAGFSFSAGLSAAKRDKLIPKRRMQEKQSVFISIDSAADTAALQTEIVGRLCQTPINYLLSWDGPAGGAFFLSSDFTPIFFKNGSTDCLRPRNFSIDTVTSRPSPCA